MAEAVLPTHIMNQLHAMTPDSTLSSYIDDVQVTGRADEFGWTLELELLQSDQEHAYELNVNHQWDQSQAFQAILDFLSNISNFNRVLYYQFLPDGSGVVTGVVLVGTGNSYLNLRYTATDIPKVARELYKKNSYRYIQNVNSEPVEITVSNRAI